MKGHFLRVAAVAAFVIGLLALTASSQTVTGSLGKVTKGKPARATVYLNLPAGLHANSSRPGNEYQIPTSVRASSVRGVRIGSVHYPRGVNKKFGFSETPINVYQGRVAFGFTV